MIRKLLLGSGSADMFIRFIVILSLLFSGVASYQAAKTQSSQNRLASCVATWADEYTAATQARSSANTERLDSLNVLLTDALSSTGSAKANLLQEQMLEDVSLGLTMSVQDDAKAFLAQLKANRSDPKILADVRAYQKAQMDYAAAIQTHPIPDPPKEVC